MTPINPGAGTVRYALAVSWQPELMWKGGKVCDYCIDSLLARYPSWSYEQMAWWTGHPQAHSTMLDACVDALMLSFLEGFNRHVAPTRFSCQGPEDCYVASDAEYHGNVQGWLRCSGDRYAVRSVTVDPYPWGSVRIAFAETPTEWRG